MPDLVRVTRELTDDRRQFVMRISEDKNAKRFRWSIGVMEWWSNDEKQTRITPLLHYSRCVPCRASYLRSVSFNNFDLSAEVVRGVQAMGFAEPTPIQLRAFPIILAGKDLIGTAQTGTGKTAAFALPILTLLGHHGKFRCLVLEPTRELAAQVETAFRDYGRFTDLRATVVHGGVGYGKQREELKRGVDVVIATPGRLLDHLEQGTLHFRDVTILVLDEVDRMLDMGFLPDVRRIVEKI